MLRLEAGNHELERIAVAEGLLNLTEAAKALQ